MSEIMVIIVYIVLIGLMIYFLMVRPQKKQERERKALYDSMAVGDYVCTTSGFYGQIMDIQDDTVIVEFGNNKNCRIAMKRSAIEQVEKAGAASEAPAEKTEEKKDDNKDEKKKTLKTK
jgi:preprotein translocase subunit YajC